MEGRTKDVKQKIRHLANYGVAGGFFGPSIIYFIADHLWFNTLSTTGLITWLFLTLGGGGLTYGSLFHALSMVGTRPKAPLWLIYFAGLTSVLCLYGVVLLSGGLIRSPFTGYFLYIPAVVALIVQRQLPVIIAAVFSMVLMVLTAFWIPSYLGVYLAATNHWDVTSKSLYTDIYLIILIWQLGATAAIAMVTFSKAENSLSH